VELLGQERFKKRLGRTNVSRVHKMSQRTLGQVHGNNGRAAMNDAKRLIGLPLEGRAGAVPPFPKSLVRQPLSGLRCREREQLNVVQLALRTFVGCGMPGRAESYRYANIRSSRFGVYKAGAVFQVFGHEHAIRRHPIQNGSLG